MKILRTGLVWIIAPLLVLVLACAFILFTSAGARLVATAAEAILEPLTIRQVDGSIAYGVRAERVVWQQPEVTVTLDGLASVWNPRCLWQGRICVESLIAGRLHIDVPQQTTEMDSTDEDFLPLALPLLVMPWRLQVEQFHLAVLEIQAGGRLTRIDPVSFRADWVGSRVVVERFHTAMTDRDIGMLDVTLSGAIEMRSEWPFDLILATDYVPPLDGWKAQQLQLSGAGNVRNLLLQGEAKASVLLPQMEPLQLHADIKTQMLDSRLNLKALRGQWQGAPLQAVGQLEYLRNGLLRFDGLQVDWGDNHALLNGSLDQQWQVDAALTLAQPQLVAPDAEGRFAGQAQLRGAMADPLVDVQLHSDMLRLRDIQLDKLQLQAQVAPLSLSSLDLQLQADRLQWADQSLEDVDVKLQGDHQAHTLAVKADTGERQLAATARGQLDPDRFDWNGQVESLRLQLNPEWIITLVQPVDLQWQQTPRILRWGQHCLQDSDGSLCSAGTLNLQRGTGDLSVDATNLQLARLRDLLPGDWHYAGSLNSQLKLAGLLTSPTLHGQLSLRQLAVIQRDQEQPLLQNGNIQARFDGQQAVVRTALDLPAGLRWNSARPVAVLWRENSLRMPRSCWQAQRIQTQDLPEAALGELCMELSTSNGNGVSAAATLDLALAPALQPWLPIELAAEGRLQAQADAHIKGRSLVANLDASVADGAMLLTREQDQPPLRFAYRTLTLQSRLQDDVLQADLALASDQLGNGAARSVIDLRPTDPLLQLQANLQGLNLEILQPLLTPVNELRGALDINLQLDGPMRSPSVNGQVDVRDVQLQTAGMPVVIDDLDAGLVFTGERGELSGKLKSGKGRADLQGEFTRQLTGWGGTVRLKGRNIPFFQPPDMRFQMHPDLLLTLDSEALQLNGNVLLNEGFVVIKPLPPGAVDVSADVEYVDERSAQLHAASNITLGMNVLASIEPSLRIRGFGAEVRPKGAVRITLDNTGVLIGRGTIDIEEGRYTGYGQRLTIRKGQVIFNGPLNQPYVNLEAVRVVDTVVAGIRVSGPASEPVATLFSEPALPDSQILHYIITGKAPGTGTEADNTAVRSALLSMGLMGSQPLARDIASKVGIDDLQMGTTGSGDATAVTVSGYLNARTYVSYGMSVFEPVNTFTVRYRLRENLFLEAVSSIESALDMLYSFEF